MDVAEKAEEKADETDVEDDREDKDDNEDIEEQIGSEKDEQDDDESFDHDQQDEDVKVASSDSGDGTASNREEEAKNFKTEAETSIEKKPASSFTPHDKGR